MAMLMTTELHGLSTSRSVLPDSSVAAGLYVSANDATECLSPPRERTSDLAIVSDKLRPLRASTIAKIPVGRDP